MGSNYSIHEQIYQMQNNKPKESNTKWSVDNTSYYLANHLNLNCIGLSSKQKTEPIEIKSRKVDQKLKIAPKKSNSTKKSAFSPSKFESPKVVLDPSKMKLGTVPGKIQYEPELKDIVLKILVKTNSWQQKICHKIPARLVPCLTVQDLKSEVSARVFGDISEIDMVNTQMNLWSDIDARLNDKALVHLFISNISKDSKPWELVIKTDCTMNDISEDDYGTNLIKDHERGIFPTCEEDIARLMISHNNSDSKSDFDNLSFC